MNDPEAVTFTFPTPPEGYTITHVAIPAIGLARPVPVDQIQAAVATTARDLGAQLALEAEAMAYELETAITRAARGWQEFTSDEVWLELQNLGIFELNHPNAFGAAFLAASRAGIIDPTDRVRRSDRAAAHRRKITVWRSLIYQEPHA